MTRYLILVALCGIFLSSASAFAAPHPTAADADNDGVPVATVDVNGDSNVNHLDIGVQLKDYDCDDDHATVSPRLTEVINDGIDNDCIGGDAVYPVAEPVAKRYLASSGSRSPLAFISEYTRCSTAIECDCDDVDGTLLINAAALETHLFVDVYCGSSKILGADGLREVVTKAEASHYRGTACPSGKVGAGASRGGSGTGTGVGKTYVDASSAVLIAADKAETEARLAADAEHDRRIGQIETGAIPAMVKWQRETEAIIAAEVKDRKEAAALLLEDIVELEAADVIIAEKVVELEGAVTAAQAHGALLEVGAVGGGIFHRPLTESDGDEVRGSAIGGGGFEARSGVDGDGYQAAGFGQVFFGSDGHGTGPDIAYLIGADVVFDAASSIEVGPWVAFIHVDDHVNYVDLAVIENGGLFGITLQGDVASYSAARIVPFARFGVGIGYYGTKELTADGTVVVSDYSPVALLQGGIRFGAGALLR